MVADAQLCRGVEYIVGFLFAPQLQVRKTEASGLIISSKQLRFQKAALFLILMEMLK
jgi:hypothetical protein